MNDYQLYQVLQIKLIKEQLVNKYISLNLIPNRMLMKSLKRSLISTPSQKSLTHVTEDSQGDSARGFFMPIQNQRRFTRKNNNSSVEKNKSKSHLETEQDSVLQMSINIQTPKSSQQKGLNAFVRLNPQLKHNKNNLSHGALNPFKSGSFRASRTKQIRLSNLEETIRISQQKYTSRRSDKSIDSKCGTKINQVAILKTELELKQKQLLILEDERRRFRNIIEDLKRKQSSFQQQLNKMQLQNKRIKQSFKQNIQDLSKKLQQYENYNKKLEDENHCFRKQMNELNKQKKIIQRQLNAFINKQIPKNVREFQSCRQISLEQSLCQAKLQLSKNKTQVEKQLEKMVEELQQEKIRSRQHINRLEIKNRLFEKKQCDAKRYLQAYTSMKQECKSVKIALKQSTQQCQLLRTQNVKIKKQMKKLKTNQGASDKKIIERRSFQIGSNSSCSNLRGNEQRSKQLDSDSQSLALSESVCSR